MLCMRMTNTTMAVEETNMLPFSLFVLTSETNDRPSEDITHLCVHSSVKEVFPKEFEAMAKLQDVHISEGVQWIGGKAFKDCSKLQSVSMPKTSLESIGYRSFHGTSLINVELKNGMQSIGFAAFGSCQFLRQVQLPCTLHKIEDWAFSHCISLVDIQLPNGLKTIGRLAFYGCTALPDISVPSSVETLGGWSFQSCTSLAKVHLEAPATTISRDIQAGTFALCKTLSHLSVPMGVEVLGGDCCCECIKLVSVELPKGLTYIEDKAFFGCQSLCAIVIPSSTIGIGHQAFCECTELLGVELFTSRKNIQFGSEAFANCPSLVTIALSSSVNNNLPHDIFSGCTRLLRANDQGNTEELLLEALQHRFAKLPVHEACYHSSTSSTEELLASIHRQQSLSANDDWRDAFGMTPFHVIATLATHRMGIVFQILLEHIPFSVLSYKDCNDNTMMDYLLQNQLPTSTLLIQTLLHKTLVDGMAVWGMKSWSLSLGNLVDGDSRQWGTTDKTTKQQSLKQVIGKLESYARLEVASLLELAVWKTKLDSIGGTTQDFNRDSCRLLCSANLVKANVLGYIIPCDYGANPKASVSLSIFPYDVSWMLCGCTS